MKPEEIAEHLEVDKELGLTIGHYVQRWVGDKTQLKYANSLVRGLEELKDCVIGLHRFLIRDRKSPREAAEFIKEQMPEIAKQVSKVDYDGMLREIEPFRKCSSMKKYIDFFEHPKAEPLLREFFKVLGAREVPKPEKKPKPRKLKIARGILLVKRKEKTIW